MPGPVLHPAFTAENFLWVSCIGIIAAVLFAQIRIDREVAKAEEDFEKIEATFEGIVESKKAELETMSDELHEMARTSLDFSTIQQELERTAKLQAEHHEKIVDLRATASVKRLQNRCLGEKNRKVCWREDLRECHLGIAYNGSKQATRQGYTCAEWKKYVPKHLGLKLEGSTCRNPNGQPGPWCYSTTLADRFVAFAFGVGNTEHYEPWDFCFEPCNKTEECINTDKESCWRSDWSRCRILGANTEKKSKTFQGKDCVDWNTVNSTLYSSYNLEKQCHMIRIGRDGLLYNSDEPWCYTDVKGESGHCFTSCDPEGKDPVIMNETFVQALDLW